MQSSMNEALETITDKCYFHIFYQSPHSNDLKYVKSCVSLWDNVFKTAEQAVIESGLGIFNLKIGIKSDQSTVPMLLKEPEFLKTSTRFKKRVLIIIATSEKKRKFIKRSKMLLILILCL